MADDDAFLSRWSRRKAQARQGLPVDEAPVRPAPAAPGAVPDAVPSAPAAVATTPTIATEPPANSTPVQPAEPPPTLADVAALTRDSDFRRFVAPGVDGEVKNAALKKLFGDPRFNVMDGLDVYIDDYSKPDPLPASMLRKLAHAAYLGLVQPEPPAVAPAQPAAPLTAPDGPTAQCTAPGPDPDENADLRLQSHDAAGCGGAEAGADADRQL